MFGNKCSANLLHFHIKAADVKKAHISVSFLNSGGTGGVSIYALQFAKMAGATVIATSSSDVKLEKLKLLGADYLINYKKIGNWGKLAREMTGGRGVGHVVEVGGPATINQSMLAARVGGHISVIGILTGIGGEISIVTALIK